MAGGAQVPEDLGHQPDLNSPADPENTPGTKGSSEGGPNAMEKLFQQAQTEQAREEASDTPTTPGARVETTAGGFTTTAAGETLFVATHGRIIRHAEDGSETTVPITAPETHTTVVGATEVTTAPATPYARRKIPQPSRAPSPAAETERHATAHQPAHAKPGPESPSDRPRFRRMLGNEESLRRRVARRLTRTRDVEASARRQPDRDTTAREPVADPAPREIKHDRATLEERRRTINTLLQNETVRAGFTAANARIQRRHQELQDAGKGVHILVDGISIGADRVVVAEYADVPYPGSVDNGDWQKWNATKRYSVFSIGLRDLASPGAGNRVTELPTGQVAEYRGSGINVAVQDPRHEGSVTYLHLPQRKGDYASYAGEAVMPIKQH